MRSIFRRKLSVLKRIIFANFKKTSSKIALTKIMNYIRSRRKKSKHIKIAKFFTIIKFLKKRPHYLMSNLRRKKKNTKIG